jgi:long-chain acyl-CoA synthetase
MLSHENLSGNALSAFASLPNVAWGDREVALSFLPLTHVFARCLLYGHLYYGHSIYFSHPNRVLKHLKEVQPTVLAVVPLFLEKIYSKILERGKKAPTWWERQVFAWALSIAKRYELGLAPHGLSGWISRLSLSIADHLVFWQWRSLFGNRLKFLLSGGAALRAELANVLNAAGVPVLQGYGLTQTSGVVCFNRGMHNRAGTVGSPIPGVEIAIAEDGEILVRGLYVTLGYYKNPAATRHAIEPQGWLHTGDLGAFADNGLLKITGLKKSLFKLSTGKYIAPQPLEARIKQSPLVKEAIVVGSERKFCAALLIPDLSALRDRAHAFGLDLPDDKLIQHPCLLALYREVIDAANCHLPYWATVKRFQLLAPDRAVANGLLITSPSEQHSELNRAEILHRFATEIDGLYGESDRRESDRSSTKNSIPPLTDNVDSSEPLICPVSPAIACPTFTQSLNPRFTS